MSNAILSIRLSNILRRFLNIIVVLGLLTVLFADATSQFNFSYPLVAVVGILIILIINLDITKEITAKIGERFHINWLLNSSSEKNLESDSTNLIQFASIVEGYTEKINSLETENIELKKSSDERGKITQSLIKERNSNDRLIKALENMLTFYKFRYLQRDLYISEINLLKWLDQAGTISRVIVHDKMIEFEIEDWQRERLFINLKAADVIEFPDDINVKITALGSQFLGWLDGHVVLDDIVEGFKKDL